MIDMVTYNQLMTMAYLSNMEHMRMEHKGFDNAALSWQALTSSIETGATTSLKHETINGVDSQLMAQWKIEEVLYHNPDYDHMRQVGDICIDLLKRR